jgi:hypothetical protein
MYKEKESYWGLKDAIASAPLLQAAATTADTTAGTTVCFPAADYIDLEDKGALVGEDAWGAVWMLPEPAPMKQGVGGEGGHATALAGSSKPDWELEG